MSAGLLALICMLTLFELGRAVPVSAATAAAVIVYNHGFVTQYNRTQNGNFIPLNRTSSITQDAPFVNAYVTAGLYAANFTWQWYDPTGQPFYNRTDPVQCVISPCTFVSYFPVAGTGAATRFGLWRMELLANGFPLYSDYLSITPVITQEDHWKFNVMQSAPALVHGDLTVTIHPDNQSWSSYSLRMPYAANVTAFEAASNRTLKVMTLNDSSVIVDLGAARADGYTFMLSFDLTRLLYSLNGWEGGSFAFTWQEVSGDRPFPDVHPIPETFNITLPQGATLADTIGMNVMFLNHNVTAGERQTVSFTTTVPPQQRFGWAIIYRDFAWRNSHLSPFPVTAVGLPFAERQMVPVLPLTLGSVSLWTAVMSVFLLTASELLSPIFARTGILINRRRLRIAALILVAIFITATAYQLAISQTLVATPTR